MCGVHSLTLHSLRWFVCFLCYFHLIRESEAAWLRCIEYVRAWFFFHFFPSTEMKWKKKKIAFEIYEYKYQLVISIKMRTHTHIHLKCCTNTREIFPHKHQQKHIELSSSREIFDIKSSIVYQKSYSFRSIKGLNWILKSEMLLQNRSPSFPLLHICMGM